MLTIAELLVDVDVDASDVEKGIDRAEQSVGSFGSRLGNAGKRLQGFGRTATTFGTAPLLALGAGAAEAASNLEESVNAIGVVFGPAADKIEAFGETSAQTVGLSTRAFNELVTPVGASLQNVGFSADEAAESSINLAERAADMASVFNVDVSEALAAIQAGLRGEADPLERFGVGLSAAAVEAHALELGLADTESELTANEKAQARLSLIMAQTDKIAGDFADTADSTANSERIMRAEAENAAAAFGQKLLPIKQQLISILSRVIDMFNGLSPSMQDTILKAVALAAAVGPVLLVMGSLMRAVTGVIGVSKGLVGGLKGLVVAFKLAGKAFLIMSRILLAHPFVLIAAAVIALVVVIVKNWDKIKKFTVRVFTAVWGFLRRLWERVWGFITRIVGRIADTVSGGFNRVVGFFRRLPGRAIGAISDLNRRMYRFLLRVMGRARDAIRNGLGSVLDFVRSIPGRIVDALGDLGDLLYDAGREVIEGLAAGIRASTGVVGGAMGGVAGVVTRYWPFSPADEGPLRRHPPEEGGANVGRLFAGGLEDAERMVVRAAEDIARAAALEPGAALSAAAPSGVRRVEPSVTVIEIRGDGSARADFIVDSLREAIRIKGGGDVQLVLGGRR